MGYARKSLISLADTPYYHVVARCVRRAWLWGYDDYAGKDYSHRKQWILDRLALLTSVFAIEVCAYAVMSNHYHLTLFIDQLRMQQLSHREVVERWTQLFGTPPIVAKYMTDELNAADREAAEAIIERWRQRLCDISWFMKSLNEYLARRANAEDGCTGKFWEGRFKSQALLDEAGLLTAMVYVDLNPIRAGVASTPEESEFTSIFERIRLLKAQHRGEASTSARTRVPLQRFATSGTSNSIPCSLADYLQLVDWTGRCVRSDKRGFIDGEVPPIVLRLGIDSGAWQRAMRPNGNVFGRAMGRLDHLRLHAKTLGQSWIRGLQSARTLYA